MWQASLFFLLALATQAYSAPQFITFKDGKLGVNFGGYHAGVGLGGLAGGGGGAGGLYAEAGTPHGQAARAGLGGAVDGSGRSAGGLYAGATAGGNVKAAAGLAGGAGAEGAGGSGFAAAQAGEHMAASGLGGESSNAGSSGFSFSGTKSLGVPTTVVKETEVSVVPVEIGKKVHTEFNVDTDNEVNPVPLSSAGNANGKANAQSAVLVKEVYVEPQQRVFEKHIVHTHYKPHRHHYKTAYIGGYVGGTADVPPPPPSAPVVYKTFQPVIEERSDVVAENTAKAANNAGQVTYTKEVTVGRNPNFFQDIFNIPISTLKAVSGFLSNAADDTSVSVQKSASIQDSDPISPKHVSPLSSSSSSDAQISVQTPSFSKLIDGIFSIPINTLGAVNKFLENNVPARKRIEVSQDGSGEPTKVRLGPHGRRRRNKQVVVVQEADDETRPKESE